MTTESNEMSMIREVVLDQIVKLDAANKITFADIVAEKTYAQLDKSWRAPHLVQFLGLEGLKRIAASLIRELGDAEAKEIEMGQADLLDLSQYRLQRGYSGERCIECGKPETAHHAKTNHRYEGKLARIPLALCSPEELWAEGYRMMREGEAKIKHGKALLHYIQIEFPDFRTVQTVQ